jgi:uracil-DNA glycosylase
LRLSSTARLLIASQAPGVKVHVSGLPFNDASGDRLRQWMGVSREVFYDEARVAIVPMGFCFPGHDADKGDLPPRRECRETWHDELFSALPQIECILAIGRFAQDTIYTRKTAAGGIGLMKPSPLAGIHGRGAAHYRASASVLAQQWLDGAIMVRARGSADVASETRAIF